MKWFIATLVAYVFIGFSLFYIGILEGRNSAFQSIILEECWLNQISRDVECIQYIKE